MFKIKTFNAISELGLKKFNSGLYQIGQDIQDPQAILLRSHDLHQETIPESVMLIARAGAGTNNIPIEKMTELGIPVLNTPGANANAVKELVLTGLLLAARNILPAWDFVRSLTQQQDIKQLVEKNKKEFAGFELPGKTLGVIGLGHIGVKIANAASQLDMRVIGYDPAITVRNAWELSSNVEQADHIDTLLSQADFVTVHVPFNSHTRHLMNQARLAKMKRGSILLNFARDGIVDNDALLQALNDKHLYRYVCDFPNAALYQHDGVISLPHLGASTHEAEQNCALMAADQIKDFLELGHIRYSVNFPAVKMPAKPGIRLAIVNSNVPNMVAQISSVLSQANINIIDMINQSREQVAYTLIDIDNPLKAATLQQMQAVEGVTRVRQLNVA